MFTKKVAVVLPDMRKKQYLYTPKKERKIHYEIQRYIR